MKDYRWNTTENWKKMEYSHRGLDESNITVHYNIRLDNNVIKEIDDIKIK